MIKQFTLIFIVHNLFCLVAQAQQNTPVTNRSIPPQCFCFGPCITSQPVSPQPVCVQNGVAVFSVTVTGTGPFQYQWRENSGNISDNTIYSGTNTPTLTITNPSYSLNGKTFRCIISNCSGNPVITNNSAVLTVTTLPSDINKDGITQATDFNLLNTIYNSACINCPEDITHDGFVNNDDFLMLLGDYGKFCQ